MTGGERPFLTAEWRDLVMLQYEVPPDFLASSIPRGTELDLWQGRALVSLVGFRFIRTRIRGVAIPFHINFDEVNLRFYVRREAPEGARRGVVFIREIVPRRAIAVIARALYNEPYLACPMRHRVQLSETSGRAQYEWKHEGSWCGVEAATTGPIGPCAPASEAEFITEHYWGYTAQPEGETLEYRVTHPRWRVWSATGSTTGEMRTMYGPAFGEILMSSPTSAFIADGSPVKVFAGHRVA
ncbi:MAG: DUF2071 domain-containing protein [Gemmatimonadota bacterium]